MYFTSPYIFFSRLVPLCQSCETIHVIMCSAFRFNLMRDVLCEAQGTSDDNSELAC